MKLEIIQKRIARCIEKCPHTGEVVAKPPYTRNHAVRIGNHVKTLMAWMYIVYNHRLPNGRVRSFSDNRLSVDPRFLISERELCEDLLLDAQEVSHG